MYSPPGHLYLFGGPVLWKEDIVYQKCEMYRLMDAERADYSCFEAEISPE